MPKSSIINWYGLSDQSAVVELGKLLKQIRLNTNMTQEALAQKSGLDRSTISQLENGRAATILTLVQVLRALQKLELMENFVEEKISPIKALKTLGKERQRASTRKDDGD